MKLSFLFATVNLLEKKCLLKSNELKKNDFWENVFTLNSVPL